MKYSNLNQKEFYLIPNVLNPDNFSFQIPLGVGKIMDNLDCIWVENPKPARAFIKQCQTQKHISEFEVLEINKNEFNHLDKQEVERILQSKNKVGFMSDAGLPCIADPGAVLVNLARKNGYKIIPISGPSSMILGLISSGFNGQQFVFHGYLPVQDKPLKIALKKMESEVLSTGYTQIFIETPYRNDKLLTAIIQTLNPATRLCIAFNLFAENQFIETKTMGEWKKENIVLGKNPAVFLIGR